MAIKANLVVMFGKVSSQVRVLDNVYDFSLETIEQGSDGKFYNSQNFVKYIPSLSGKTAEIKLGDRISLEGKLRNNEKNSRISYVECNRLTIE